MNREERLYFIKKLQQMVAEWFDRHTHVSANVGNIALDTFMERRMSLITGQQMLPQEVFRSFINELHLNFIDLQSDIDKVNYDHNQDHQLLELLLRYFGSIMFSKPIVNCVAITNESDIVEPIEGRYYLIPPSGSFGGKLFIGLANNTYTQETPDVKSVYLTTGVSGTNYYAYDSTKFVKINYADDIIRTDRLAPLVNRTLNPGVYQVEHFYTTEGKVYITQFSSNDTDVEGTISWLDSHTDQNGAAWEGIVDLMRAGGITIAIDGSEHTIIKSVQLPSGVESFVFVRYHAGDVPDAAAPYAWKYGSFVYYTESDSPVSGDVLYFASNEEPVPGQEGAGASAGNIAISDSITYTGSTVNQDAIDVLYASNATYNVDVVSSYVLNIYTMIVYSASRILNGAKCWAESGENDWIWHRYIFQEDLTTDLVKMMDGETTLTQYLNGPDKGYTYSPISKSFTAGTLSRATGYAAFAEGNDATSSGTNAHAEGYKTTASGNQSHAEGNQTLATAPQAHSEGYGTSATANGAHAEGDETVASGGYSHAEGESNTASGYASHAEGEGNTAPNRAQHVSGKFATIDNTGKVIFQVGDGTDSSHRHDAIRVDTDITLNASNGLLGLNAGGGASMTMDDGINFGGDYVDLNHAVVTEDNQKVFIHGVGGFNGDTNNSDQAQTVQEVMDKLAKLAKAGIVL